jgi:hypothetical protein
VQSLNIRSDRLSTSIPKLPLEPDALKIS